MMTATFTALNSLISTGSELWNGLGYLATFKMQSAFGIPTDALAYQLPQIFYDKRSIVMLLILVLMAMVMVYLYVSSKQRARLEHRAERSEMEAMRADARYSRIVDFLQQMEEGNIDHILNFESQGEFARVADLLKSLANRQKNGGGGLPESKLDALVRGQRVTLLRKMMRIAGHDLRNVSGAVENATELMELSSDKDDTSASKVALEAIRNSAQRGRQTILLLQKLVGEHHESPANVNLNNVLAVAHQLSTRTLESSAQIQLHPFENQAIVCGCFSGLVQMILNLIINSVEAKDDATVTLTISLDPAWKSSPDTNPREAFMVTITDDGPGFPEDLLKTLGKEPLNGNNLHDGLGVFASSFIAKQNDGELIVSNRSEGGAVVTIRLPRVHAQLEDTPANGDDISESVPQDQPNADSDGPGPIVKPEELPQANDNECVILVDDEKMLRKINAKLLEKIGYRVIEAGTVQEAISAFSLHADDCSCVVLDLILPDGTGHDVFKALRDIRQDAKILLMSGHSRDPRVADLLVAGCNGFLQKPFSASDLARSIRAIIDGDE